MNKFFFILSSLYLVGFSFGGFVEIFINILILILVIVSRQSTNDTTSLVAPAPKPPAKTEKDIQAEILTVCRKLIPESQIVDSLFSIVESRAETLNIIHACTIAHRLVGIRNAVVNLNQRFINISCKLISEELVHVKTAVTLAKNIVRLVGSSVEDMTQPLLNLGNRIIDRNIVVDSTTLLQLIQLGPFEKSEWVEVSEKLVNVLLANKLPLTQTQLLWFVSTEQGRNFFTPSLIELVDKFEVCGFHTLVQFCRDKHPELVPILSSRLVVEIDKNRLPYIADLIAAASAVPKNETLIDVLVEQFFDISHASIVGLFLTRSSGNSVLTSDQIEQLKCAVLSTECEDRKKIFLALRVLAINGVVIDHSFKDKFKSIEYDELFEFLSINYGIGQDIGKLTLTSWRTVDFVNFLPQRFTPSQQEESELNHTDCEIRNLLSIVASRNSAFAEIQKLNRRKIDRFIPHNFVDAVNWLMCVGPRHDRAREVENEWLNATEFGLDGFVLTCVRALKQGSHCLSNGAISGIEEQLCKRLVIVPDSFLPDVLEVVAEPVRVVDEIRSRLIRGVEFSVRDIAYLINLFGRKKLKIDKIDEDKLFQAIQAWIVPRVNKFGLADIGAIATALEGYTGNFQSEPGSAVESLASIDTPVGLAGH
jgi:hypothetical protein